MQLGVMEQVLDIVSHYFNFIAESWLSIFISLLFSLGLDIIGQVLVNIQIIQALFKSKVIVSLLQLI
jgi:hypothetical protein